MLSLYGGTNLKLRRQVLLNCLYKQKIHKGLISITGAGGKTSLLLYLGHVLSLKGSVILTTTTHICVKEIPKYINTLVGTMSEIAADLENLISSEGIACIAKDIENDKFAGFLPEEIDMLNENNISDFILVEADGSKKFPIKGYGINEPVIPKDTTYHVVVVGAEIFFEPLSEKNIFRPSEFFSSANIEKNSLPSSSEIAFILESPNIFLKGTPQSPKVKRILVINKIDLLKDKKHDRVVDETISKLRKYDFVWKTSLRELKWT